MTGMSEIPRPSVAHLTSVHRPFDIRIFQKELRSLARVGWPVTLIARHTHDEKVDGVQIRAIRGFNGRLRRMTLTVCAVLREAVRSRAEICHFHDPELIFVGFVLKLLGRKVIYDVHEDLPRQIESKHWIVPFLKHPIALLSGAIEWMAGRFFDRIVVVTPVIARRFPPGKTIVVQNYPMPEELFDVEGTPYARRPPVICYAGGISEARGAYEMVDAIAEVDGRLDPQLHLAGEFVPASLRQALEKRRGWARTTTHGVLDRAGIRNLLGSSRAGLVLLHPHPNHLNAQPIKLYEYMAAGLPVIASDFPLWQEIVGRNGAGLLIDPMDPGAIARAIEWVLDHPEQAAAMGSKGRSAVIERLNWSEEEKKLLAMYEGLR
ncbi:MAG: hypothetical protein NFCOHLIN_02873 [Gammaproteobacteria bacterium]|nr:hypothetical protein [Gammaproteobacteria bacterium]